MRRKAEIRVESRESEVEGRKAANARGEVKPMKVLLAGAFGNLGSRTIESLLDQGHEVRFRWGLILTLPEAIPSGVDRLCRRTVKELTIRTERINNLTRKGHSKP